MPAANVMNPPIAVKSRADHDADDWRAALGMSFAAGGSATVPLPRGGILPGFGAELSVAQRSTPGMGVLVGSGIAYVAAPTAGHGGWNVVHGAQSDLTIAAAHATLPRTDLLIARVADPQYYVGGDGAADVKVITGTAGTGAPVPAVPVAEGAYMVLGQIAVAAAATSITNANITLNTSASRPYTSGLGGILPVANAAARTALRAYHGLVVLQIDTGAIWAWANGAWQAQSPTTAQWPKYSDNTVNVMGLSNVTAGNYTHDVYVRITPDKVCHVEGRFVVNNTGTGRNEVYGLPPFANPLGNIGRAFVRVQGVWRSCTLFTTVVGGTSVAMYVDGTTGSYVGDAGYVFAAGDSVHLNMMYQTTAAPN